MRNAMSILVVMLIVLVGVVSVEGATMISDPDQLVDTSYSQSVRMAYGDNLMERIDGADLVVDKGVGESYIFFAKNVSGGMEFGAYLETDNDNSDNYTGYEGWCMGLINRNLFLDGDSPDYVLAIYDPDGGQFAELEYGALSFDINLSTWLMDDIEYDGVIGGFSNFVLMTGAIRW